MLVYNVLLHSLAHASCSLCLYMCMHTHRVFPEPFGNKENHHYGLWFLNTSVCFSKNKDILLHSTVINFRKCVIDNALTINYVPVSSTDPLMYFIARIKVIFKVSFSSVSLWHSTINKRIIYVRHYLKALGKGKQM